MHTANIKFKKVYLRINLIFSSLINHDNYTLLKNQTDANISRNFNNYIKTWIYINIKNRRKISNIIDEALTKKHISSQETYLFTFHEILIM